MKKTMVILAVMLVALVSNVFGADEPKETVAKGVYTLVTVNGSMLPATVSHGNAKIMVHSGSFTINADKTCVSKIIFGAPSGDKVNREVKATWTREGSTLNMQWKGAGRTKGTINADTFTMNNEGMIFAYKKETTGINDTVKSSSAAMKAYELRMNGKSDEAKEFLEKHLKENPKDAKAWFELGRLEYYVTGSSVEDVNGMVAAQTAIRESINIDPNNPRAHFLVANLDAGIGLIMHFTGMPEEGGKLIHSLVPSYEHALELKPDYHELRLELIRCYSAPKDWGLDPFPGEEKKSLEKSKKYAEILQQMDPVYAAKYKCEHIAKNRKEKLEILEKLISDNKDNPAAYEVTAIEYLYDDDLFYSSNKRYEYVEKSIKKDRRGSRGSPFYKILYGEDLPGDMEKAIKYIDKAIELDSSQSTLLLNLAWKYDMRKDYVKAQAVLQRFINMESNLQPIRAKGLYHMASIKKLLGKSKEADELRAAAEKLDPVWVTSGGMPRSERYSKP